MQHVIVWPLLSLNCFLRFLLSDTNATERGRKSIGFLKKTSKRQILTEQIGPDGWVLLSAIRSTDASAWLAEVPVLEVLRCVWAQHFGWMKARFDGKEIRIFPQHRF